MNILIKLTCLIGLVIAPILGGSTEGSHSNDEMLSPQPIEVGVMTSSESSSMTAQVASFEFDRDLKVISAFTFNSVECNSKVVLCNEVNELAGKKEMSFSASTDALDYKGELEFDRKVKGILIVGKDEIPAELLFNVRKVDEGAMFLGMLTFKNISMFKYAADEVSIYLKGKQ